jgi:hypothetical protein
LIEALSGAVGMAPLEKASPKRREDAATLLTVMPAHRRNSRLLLVLMLQHSLRIGHL